MTEFTKVTPSAIEDMQDTVLTISARWLFTGGVSYGDANAWIGLVAGAPIVSFDENDYDSYDRPNNIRYSFIGGVAKTALSPTGLTLSVHALVNADSTYDIGATAVRVRVGYLDDLSLRPSASRTPAANGDLEIEATNNTTLTFKFKGSDGTVRSGTVTLS
jgi:hypothetical protein